MSKRTLTITAMLLTVTWSAAISLAGWTIDTPVNGTTFMPDENVDGHGECDTGPSSRWVGFGTDIAGGVEQHVNTSAQKTMSGMWEWACTLIHPSAGWALSPTDGMGMPIGDHQFWLYSNSGQTPDTKTTGHIVSNTP